MADRLKSRGKYWILEGLGPQYPFPLGIRADHLPSWKRHSQSLQRVRKDLGHVWNEVRGLEEEAVVGSRSEGMPGSHIFEAVNLLDQAIAWMKAFPSRVALRSKYREAMRVEAESHSAGVLAYVLNKLYREHSTQRLKAKNIECKIADIQTRFLAKNISSHPDFGCPAVCAQIRQVKRSPEINAIDHSLEAVLKQHEYRQWFRRKSEEIGSSRELSKRISMQLRLLRKFGQHHQAYDAWLENSEAALKSALKVRINTSKTSQEMWVAADDYNDRMHRHLDTARHWLSELGKHMEAADSVDGDFYGRIKAARDFMAHWENIWSDPHMQL